MLDLVQGAVVEYVALTYIRPNPEVICGRVFWNLPEEVHSLVSILAVTKLTFKYNDTALYGLRWSLLVQHKLAWLESCKLHAIRDGSRYKAIDLIYPFNSLKSWTTHASTRSTRWKFYMYHTFFIVELNFIVHHQLPEILTMISTTWLELQASAVLYRITSVVRKMASQNIFLKNTQTTPNSLIYKYPEF